MELGERIAYANVPVVKRESIYLKTKKKRRVEFLLQRRKEAA